MNVIMQREVFMYYYLTFKNSKEIDFKKCIISIMTLRGKRGKTMKQKLTFKENLFIGSMLLVCSLEQET